MAETKRQRNDQILNKYQHGVADKNEIEILDMAERHVELESPVPPLFTSLSQNDQADDGIVVDIKKKLLLGSKKPPLSTRLCCIYIVPHVLRQINEDAYTPKLVSIGPLHYRNPRLQNMERHKQLLFKVFIEQANTRLEDLVSCVKSSEPKVRACYSENIELSESELVKLILVDAGFIIELFLKDHKKWPVDDSIVSVPWLLGNLSTDLCFLENQLPFFILEERFYRAFPPHISSDLPSFIELTFDFFSGYNIQNIKPNPHTTIEHFTDLLRIFYLREHNPPERQSLEEAGSLVLPYSASELHEAGLKLKLSESECLLELKFSGDTFEIPQILVNNKTETIFRNMIALEQFHYPFQSYVADYALVLDCLINSSKDVDHQEIIRSFLADNKDVVKLFNGLCKEIIHIDFGSDYLDICKRLNVFYKDPWNNMKATLRDDYCKTPWQTAASIARILLLIFTLVQSICSVIQVA